MCLLSTYVILLTVTHVPDPIGTIVHPAQTQSVDYMVVENNAGAILTLIPHILATLNILILITASGHAPVDSLDNTMVISLLNHVCCSAL